MTASSVARRFSVEGAPAVGGCVALGIGLAVLAGWQPELAVLALVALAAGAWLLSRPRVSIYLFVFTIPLEYAVRLHGSQTLTITKLAGVLCFASVGLFLVRTGRPLRLDRSHALLGGLLLVSLASSVQAQSASEGFAATLRYLSWFLLYTVVTQFVGEPGFIERVLWVYCLAAGISGALGTMNFLDGTTTLADLKYAQANDFAFVLASALPLGAYLLVRYRGWRRALAAALVGLMSAGVVLSFSRGGWLAVAAAFAFLGAVDRKHARALLAIVATAAVVTGVFVQLNPAAVSQGASAKFVVAAANVESRLTLYGGAIALTEAHPLLGVGPGNFGNYYYVITGAPPGSPPLLVAHDTYLEVLAELGVIGFLLFAAFLWLAWRRAWQVSRGPGAAAGLAAFICAADVAVLVGCLTLSEEFFAPIWLVAALATVLWRGELSASSR